MTQGFDEWFKETGSLLPRRAYMAGAASRQAEINALSALGEMSEQKIDDLVLRNIELQKRLDMYEREGYKLVPVDELLRKVQNIRALNTGEYASDEIEENVCEIESMIGAYDD